VQSRNMGSIRNFEDMDVWQRARQLCESIHLIITRDPFARDFGLRDQMNRSSGSIMDNIAEGFERESRNEFIQFLSYAKSSASELRSQLHRAKDRDYVSEAEFTNLYDRILEIGKMLGGFMNYLKKCEIKGLKYKVSEGDFVYESAQRI
jgi:four helix bundle protein